MLFAIDTLESSTELSCFIRGSVLALFGLISIMEVAETDIPVTVSLSRARSNNDLFSFRNPKHDLVIPID